MSDKMTIAQALRRIKKLKGLMAESAHRAQVGVRYDASQVPAFRYQASFDAMVKAQQEMLDLESRVAVANAQAGVHYQGTFLTLARAIRELQELKGRVAFLKGLNLKAETIKDRQSEWDDTEMKHITRVTETVFVSDLSEQARDKQVKQTQDEFETLNNLVEDANHIVTV